MLKLDWRYLLLALLSGGLTAALFPPVNLVWLAPVCLTPLLFALDQTADWRHRALLGLSAGMVYWAAVCPWIEFVLEVHGGMGAAGGWATFVLFAFLKALHLAVFSVLAGLLMRTPLALLGVPALWVALDRTHATFGFQWLMIGNAGIDMDLLMRLAPITGVYGLTFLFVMLATAIALILRRRSRPHYAGVLILAMLPMLPAVPAAKKPTAKVAVLQPDIDVETRWTAAAARGAYQQYATQSLITVRQPVDLIAWPEIPAPFYYNDDADFRALVNDLVAKTQSPMITGTVLFTKENEPRNSAVLINPPGQLAGVYDKVNLVPFGEFVPPIFSWVNRISHEIGDFVPGTGAHNLATPGHATGTVICYEIAFPHYVREFTHQGAQLILNLSNDGYFGRSAAGQQHLLIARMRAAENGRWLVRVTNSGITASVDPAGRLAQTLPPGQPLSAILSFNWANTMTPYVTYGDWFVYFCAICAITTIIARSRASNKTAE